MTNKNTITNYINSRIWDFREKPNIPLFVEQKVEPTTIHLSAQAILAYNKSFTNNDMANSSAVTNILQITMGKPAANLTKNELNKLFGQQLHNFFWFCGLLNATKKGIPYHYSITPKNKWLLELLATSVCQH